MLYELILLGDGCDLQPLDYVLSLDASSVGKRDARLSCPTQLKIQTSSHGKGKIWSGSYWGPSHWDIGAVCTHHFVATRVLCECPCAPCQSLISATHGPQSNMTSTFTLGTKTGKT